MCSAVVGRMWNWRNVVSKQGGRKASMDHKNRGSRAHQNNPALIQSWMFFSILDRYWNHKEMRNIHWRFLFVLARPILKESTSVRAPSWATSWQRSFREWHNMHSVVVYSEELTFRQRRKGVEWKKTKKGNTNQRTQQKTNLLWRTRCATFQFVCVHFHPFYHAVQSNGSTSFAIF